MYDPIPTPGFVPGRDFRLSAQHVLERGLQQVGFDFCPGVPQCKEFERFGKEIRVVVGADVASGELEGFFREVHEGLPCWLIDIEEEASIFAQARNYGNSLNECINELQPFQRRMRNLEGRGAGGICTL
ncbi:hypothetical protein D3C76_849610 [compost metagenome]